MPKFIIPNEVVESESGQRDDVFPKGTWEGTIEKLHLRTITQGEGGDFFLKTKEGEYFAESCEIANLQIGDITAILDGQPNIGGLKYFESDIFLSFDGLNWDDYQDEDGDNRWRLRQTQLRLTKLAKAIGMTEEGEGGVGPVNEFDNFLRITDEGEGLNGMVVRFKVIHRTFKKRDGSEGKQAQTSQFYPAG